MKPRDWSTKQTIVFGVAFFSGMIAIGIVVAEMIRVFK